MNKEQLAREVEQQYEASFAAKEDLGLHGDWADFEDYWRGDQNQETEDTPGSVTNIITPIVESSVADLVNSPIDILVEGIEPSDAAFAKKVELALRFIWNKNNMIPKQDVSERQRAKFGAMIYKIPFEGSALGGRGMPLLEPINVANFFPDPKVKSVLDIDYGDYMIHAVMRPASYLKRKFGSVASQVQTNDMPTYDPRIYAGEANYGSDIARDQNLLLERWTIEKDGRLRKVCCAGGVVLYDSDKDKDGAAYYPTSMYPFMIVPCYNVEGSLWGIGDVELLKPVQDLINDLDDQIRMNARLMGNLQVVISIASGINPLKWTNKPGLRIPSRDVNGFKLVEPPSIPAYITQRRDQALMYESQMISGRTDVTEGRKPGGVRAASAIIALQEAGSRRINHKKLMAQQGYSRALRICLDYIKEFWTEEIAFRVTGMSTNYGEQPYSFMGDDWIWFRGSELNSIPMLNRYGEQLMQYDENGFATPLLKSAEMDINVNIGAGLPNNKAYIYQAVLELVQYGIVTREEGRAVLKQIMSFPIIDPWMPQGEFAGNMGSNSDNMNTNNGGMTQPSADQVVEALSSMMTPEMAQQMAMQQQYGGGMGGFGG